ncbi:MAG TPA: hypothetical protein VMT30_00410 [Candidatus Saccharimonadia bacterium]|nr:hypothetical protein [Candidatus Saccharimonadia bacterium]
MSGAAIDYEQYPLKRYRFWSVYLHYNQAYLGRCYIALNRSGNLDPFSDTTVAERAELESVVGDVRAALNVLYGPSLFNYANFRNTWPRCHWHVIPRYETAKTIGGVEFRDDNWGKNYAPYDRNFSIPRTLLLQIKADISRELS